MRYISQGRMDVLPACPRKYFLSYHLDGQGYEEVRPSLPLWIGLATHAGLEALLKQDLEAAINTVISYPEQDGLELGEARRLALGMVVAWAVHRLPALLDRYYVVEIEYKVELGLTPTLALIGRIDLILKDKETGVTWAFNFKTTNSLKDWSDKFAFDIQAWTEALAYEQQSGVEVPGVVYEGLYKGGVYNDRSTSPLISDGKGKTRREIPLEYIPEWVEGLPAETLDEQFSRSIPTFKDNLVVEEWIDELARHEADVDYILSLPLEEQLRYFQRRRSSANCRWCPFKMTCWFRVPISTLVEQGKLRKRETPITIMNQESDGG